MIRFVVHAALAVFALSAFGVEACPFLHRFGAAGLMAVLAGSFVTVTALRPLLVRFTVTPVDPVRQPARQLWTDIGLFVGAGVLVMLFNAAFLGFPLHSGLRIVIGALTFGLFAGLDSALDREREVLLRSRSSGGTGHIGTGYFSLSRKFAAVAFALFTLLTVDLLLLGLQDIRTILDVTENATPPPLMNSQRELMLESILSLLVLIPLMANLIISFARNLRLFLDNQREVLEAVAGGRLDVSVPVASRDEFAVIADRTNQMIAGLRERKRISELVGKLVSPAIAARLLASTDGFKLGGSRRQVVVLFSDVRNFTTRTESTDPEELVADLNRYFTEMVACVHLHGGVVDKFIGDGMMAIFGLEQFEGAAEAAVLSACEMHRRLNRLNEEFRVPMQIGVGIHAGEVVAGTIGSPDRLEFTFIGDAVNAAARIEGLTKELGASPLVSAAVKDALSGEPLGWAWQAAGEQALKGKHQTLALFKLEAAIV